MSTHYPTLCARGTLMLHRTADSFPKSDQTGLLCRRQENSVSLAGDNIGWPAIYICPHRVVPPYAHTTPRRSAPSAPSTPSAPHTTSPAVTPPTATPILSHCVRGPRHLPSPAAREYSFPVTLATPPPLSPHRISHHPSSLPPPTCRHVTTAAT